MTTTLVPTGQAFADDNNGLIVPMYGWDARWDDVIDTKEENGGTEIIDEDIKVVDYVATS
jgi:hypothetical protein